MRIRDFFLLFLAGMVLLAITFDANAPVGYMKMTVTGPVRDEYTERPPMADSADLTVIRGLHQDINARWVPEYDRADGSSIDVRVYYLSPDTIEVLCPGAWACTLNVPDDPQFVGWLNNGNGVDDPQQVSAGSCVMFLPARDADFPRTWFYGVGHEFMHCVHGNFHPELGIQLSRPDDR